MSNLAPADVYVGYSGLIDANAATKIAGTFNALMIKGHRRFYFCLNSLGGYVNDGIAIYNHLRGLPIELVTHNIGNCHSIAVTVFLAGNERLTSKHAMFLVHPTTFSRADGQNWERLDGLLKGALADEERVDDVLRDRCTLPQDVMTGRRNRDTYLSPQHAVEYGIAHGISEFSLPRGKEIFQI